MEPWHPQKVHGQWWSQCLTHATVLIQFLISPLRSWNSSWDLLSFVSPEHSLQQTPGNQVLHWQILLQQGLQQPCTRCLRARSSIFLLKCRCHFTVLQGHSYLNANGKPSQTQISHNCLILLGNGCMMLRDVSCKSTKDMFFALQWWKLDFQAIKNRSQEHWGLGPSRVIYSKPSKRTLKTLKTRSLVGGIEGLEETTVMHQEHAPPNSILKTYFYWTVVKFKGMFAF